MSNKHDACQCKMIRMSGRGGYVPGCICGGVERVPTQSIHSIF